MHRRLIGKRASLSRWLIQVIFNRSLCIIRFPLIYYAYIQYQPQYHGFEHAEPCVLRHCLKTSPSYVLCCLHNGNMVFWISIFESNGFYSRISYFVYLLLKLHCTLLKLLVSFRSVHLKLVLLHWTAIMSSRSLWYLIRE